MSLYINNQMNIVHNRIIIFIDDDDNMIINDVHIW